MKKGGVWILWASWMNGVYVSPKGLVDMMETYAYMSIYWLVNQEFIVNDSIS